MQRDWRAGMSKIICAILSAYVLKIAYAISGAYAIFKQSKIEQIMLKLNSNERARRKSR
jgi:hypothetical protein